jgi:tetratricopeptide (TPR) repeat protein
MAGPREDAIAILEEAERQYCATGDLMGEARASALLCELYRIVGAGPEAVERPLAVLARMRGLPPSGTRARLGAALSRLHFALGHYDSSKRLASAAAGVAARAGARGIQASAEVRWGAALLALGRLDEARTVLKRAIRRAEQIQEHAALSEGLRAIAPVYEGLGEIGTAWKSVDRAAQIEERFGSGAGLAWAVMLRGQLAQAMGAWEDARRDYGRAADLYRLMPPTVFSTYVGLVMGELDTLTGTRESGREAIEQALSAFRTFRHRVGIQRAEIALAELAIAEGHPENAIARLEAWRGESSDSEVLYVAPVLAEAYLRAGSCERARAILDAAEEPARIRGYRILEAPLRQVRGCIAAREGRWEAARQAFEEALTADAGMPRPLVRACTLYHYGLAEAAFGDPRAARARLIEALAIFRRLGARPYVQQVERALPAVTRLPHPPHHTDVRASPGVRPQHHDLNRSIPG